MPKRMLDDSLLTSPSLATCPPAAQDAFHRLILLADDFGCFEVVPRVLFARGWPYRSDVTEDDLASWLIAYEAADMLFAWEEGGRLFAYLTGWHGEHGQKARVEYDPATKEGRHGSKRRTPRPPGFVPGASRFVPARESAGLARLRNPNVFLPARETPISRQFPATVVPVPVPVADPLLSVAQSAPGDGATPPGPAPLVLVAGAVEAAKPSKPRKPKSETDPRLIALRDVWEAEYLAAYGTPPDRSPADNAGYHRVIGVAPEVFRERAYRALRAQGFLRCGTAAKLTSAEVWAQLAGAGPPLANGKVRVIAPVGEFKEGDVF